MTGPLVVTAKEGPDIDGAACAVGYAELLVRSGTRAVAVISGEPDGEARFVLGASSASFLTAAPTGSGDVVLVDASDIAGLPPFVAPERVVEVIDHRFPHEAHRAFPRARVQVETVGAAATLVAERYDTAGITPTRAVAMLLQAAILSNTQGLRGSVTTGRDHAAADHLAECHPLPEGFLAAQFAARRSDLEDLDRVLATEAKTFEDPDGPFVVSQVECPGATELVDECLARSTLLGPRAMINLVDPVLPASVLVVPNPAVRAWLVGRTGLRFVGAVSHQPEVLLRKQILARIAGTRP